MKEIMIPVTGRKIAAVVYGNPKAPTVLALHGWLDNAATFEKLAPELEDKFHIIAIDFAGHGHSDLFPQGSNFEFIDFLGDLDDLIRYLKIQPALIIGHSMGAAIASLYAGAMPEMISKLVLIDFIGPITAPVEHATQQLNRFLMERHAYITRTKNPTEYDSLEDMVAARLRSGKIPVDLAQKLVERNSDHEGGSFHWRYDRRLRIATPMRMTEEQAHVILKNVVAPTLLYVAQDTINEYGTILNRRAECIQNLTLKVVQGHHYLHWDDAKIIAPEIKEFLGN